MVLRRLLAGSDPESYRIDLPEVEHMTTLHYAVVRRDKIVALCVPNEWYAINSKALVTCRRCLKKLEITKEL